MATARTDMTGLVFSTDRTTPMKSAGFPTTASKNAHHLQSRSLHTAGLMSMLAMTADLPETNTRDSIASSRQSCCSIKEFRASIGKGNENIPIESVLTRELGIRFIDARGLVTEAKANHGITGYTCKDDETMILEEALNIFDSKSNEVQESMRRLRRTLDCLSATESILGCTDSILSGVDADEFKSVDSSSMVSSMSKSKRSSVGVMKSLFKGNSKEGKR